MHRSCRYTKPDEAISIMQRIKGMLDPNHIMNPYKFLPQSGQQK